MFKVEEIGGRFELRGYSDTNETDNGRTFLNYPNLKALETAIIKIQAEGNAMYNALARYKETHGIS